MIQPIWRSHPFCHKFALTGNPVQRSDICWPHLAELLRAESSYIWTRLNIHQCHWAPFKCEMLKLTVKITYITWNSWLQSFWPAFCKNTQKYHKSWLQYSASKKWAKSNSKHPLSYGRFVRTTTRLLERSKFDLEGIDFQWNVMLNAWCRHRGLCQLFVLMVHAHKIHSVEVQHGWGRQRKRLRLRRIHKWWS